MFEQLECRRLLSTGLTASQSGSELTVNGGSIHTQVSIFEHPDVDNRVVVENITTLEQQVFDGITKVFYRGQAATDDLFLRGRNVSFDARTNGGNDSITISDLGDASSVIAGDGGDDSLIVLAANGTTLIGDGGGDLIVVSDHVDVNDEVHLYGLGGADFFSIAGGTNYIYGGGGQDELFTNGVEGVDYIIAVINSVETTSGI